MVQAAPAVTMNDERGLLKISLRIASDETYMVSILNAEGNKEFRNVLADDDPAYFQLCLFQNADSGTVRLHFQKGNLVGVLGPDQL